MTAFLRLWRDAGYWRAALILAILCAALAAVFPPAGPENQPVARPALQPTAPASPAPSSSPSAAPAGPTLTLRDRTIPLPPGDWAPVAELAQTVNGRPVALAASAVIADGALQHFAIASLSGADNGGAVGPAELCARSDVFHREIARNQTDDVDCWALTHRDATLWPLSNAPMENAVARFATARGVAWPNTLLQVRYAFGRDDRRMTIDYVFNPEAAGFAPARIATRAVNDWSNLRISRDPDRLRYMDRIRSWAFGWWPLSRSAFTGDPPDRDAYRRVARTLP